LGCGELDECTTFNDQTRQKIEKVVTALKITSRTQAYGGKSTRAHGVGRLIVFVGLTVSTKGSTAMIFVGKAMAQDNLTRAKVGRDTVGHGEVVEPHRDEVHKMNQHDAR
jgi:hypothetical protein